MGVLEALIRDGFSLARSVELAAQCLEEISRKGLVHPVDPGEGWEFG